MRYLIGHNQPNIHINWILMENIVFNTELNVNSGFGAIEITIHVSKFRN